MRLLSLPELMLPTFTILVMLRSTTNPTKFGYPTLVAMKFVLTLAIFPKSTTTSRVPLNLQAKILDQPISTPRSHFTSELTTLFGSPLACFRSRSHQENLTKEFDGLVTSTDSDPLPSMSVSLWIARLMRFCFQPASELSRPLSGKWTVFHLLLLTDSAPFTRI